ncbi:MAG: hypothetical protein AB8B93_13340 [Pseudomonadales bacterium]
MNPLQHRYRRLCERFGRRRVLWVGTLLLIALASLSIRLLIFTGLDHSALLYVLVPYGCALLIATLRPMQPGTRWWRGYLDFSLTSLVVFLGSSVVLYEGFVCVAIFLPIYFAVVTLAFVSRWLTEVYRNHKAGRMAALLPALMLVASVEGVVTGTSFPREETITVQRTIALPAVQVIERLRQPVDLDQPRHWLLTLFPAPEPLPAQRFEAGAIHAVQIVYPRWFFTNVHRGTLRLQIDSVGARHTRTRVLSDTTLFGNYMTLHGTDIAVQTTHDQHSQVSMTVRYHRKLDPSWYFGPLMRFGVARMAEFLIEAMVVRKAPESAFQTQELPHEQI